MSNSDSSDDVPAMHPMDPRRGETISPRFAAVLCWLLQLPPITVPAITGISISELRVGRCRARR